MSEHQPPTDSRDRTDSFLSEDTMATLLRTAGPRTAAPRHLKADVQAAVENAWQGKIRRRTARRRTVFALAAGLLLALGAAVLFRSQIAPIPVDGPAVATVEAWFGGSAPPFEPGAGLHQGDEVATLSSERAALRLSNGLSLRLDHDTRLRLPAARTVELLTGTVYVDSGPAASTDGTEPQIEIRTALGTAVDVGTQFEVRLGPEALRIRVREGEVRLEVNGRNHSAEAGTGLSVTAGGEVEKTDLHESVDWSWAVDSAPAFDLEGSNLAAALDWVARETGWRLVYEDAALEEEARTVVTRGSLEGLTPDQAPELIVPSAGFAYTLKDGVLFIRRDGP